MDLFSGLEKQTKEKIAKVDGFIDQLFLRMELPPGAAIRRLQESMKYSATNGGKRFRPLLSLLVGDLFGCEEKKILPFAAAVEMIHTYSLIHDDLPCMDNDNIRRGKPTNHKVYGEATALLAGDALLTESFLIIAEAYQDDGILVSKLVQLLSKAAGLRGMVGGQALDLAAEKQSLQQTELIHLHQLKTGCLIAVAIEGAGLIAGAKETDRENLKLFGQNLGLAFQIADDILDYQEKGQEERSFVTLLGFQGAQKQLEQVGHLALESLQRISLQAFALEQLIQFNQSRQV